MKNEKLYVEKCLSFIFLEGGWGTVNSGSSPQSPDSKQQLFIWAATRENLSSGCPIKWDSNQSHPLHRIARKLKVRLIQV